MADPYVSVVILTRDIPEKVLGCLRQQTFQDFETIIASEKGIVRAMNKAIARAKGKIFVRVDDDVLMPPEWLEQLIKPLECEGVAGSTGPTLVPKERRGFRDSIRIAENPNWFLRWMFDGQPYARAKIYDCGSVSYGSNFEEAHHEVRWHGCDHLEGTNWAMKTDLIRKVGGFDPSFDGVAEWFDTDVEQKIKKLGYDLIYNPDAYLFHMLEKGDHYAERFEVFGRIENWLRFHTRHSKFHYKKVIWFLMLVGYALWPKSR